MIRKVLLLLMPVVQCRARVRCVWVSWLVLAGTVAWFVLVRLLPLLDAQHCRMVLHFAINATSGLSCWCATVGVAFPFAPWWLACWLHAVAKAGNQ